MTSSDDLLLRPLRSVSAGLASGHTLTIDGISPPYPCAGTGCLRVIRATPTGESVALTAAYDGYRRL